MSKKRLLNDEWEFLKASIGQYDIANLKEAAGFWQRVDLPHDFLIEQTDNLYENCEGWYRRTLYTDGCADMETFLRLEGVYMDSAVYVNEALVGEWKYGYSTFEFAITPFLKPGENEIVVRVTHQSPNSRWYSGAGIYRNVWLIHKKPAHIVSDSFYVSTNRLGMYWEVTLSAKATSEGFLCFSMKDEAGVQVASAMTFVQENSVAETTMQVYKPQLWDLDIPHLYEAEVSLIVDGEVTDSEACRIGFRTLEFTNDRGLLLNERPIKLQGVCMHHDLGALGAAVNKEALRRQLCIMRRMGANAIRTSHNMPAVELMDLADEMGFLVLSEGFDMWERPKTEYDYARFFKNWVQKDIESWVCRDRNHPSLLMWSVGNEIYDTHADAHGQDVIRLLMDTVRLYDYRNHAPTTFGSNYMPWVNTQLCADIIKYVGYNYAEYLYPKHHEAHPDWFIYGSETASVVQSRGIYHFPANTAILSDDDLQCSSLGNSTTSWGAKSHYACICDDRDAEYSLGQFIWSGFDYIGEPTPYHTKNSYFGQVDTAGFEKDSYYIYQAEWTDYHYAPMIHITPYWDFNEGQLIDVFVYSNAPKMELFFNNESMGTFACDHKKDRNLSGKWQLPYKEGELRAVAYDENGMELCETTRHSFGDAREIVLSPNKKELLADGRDMIFVEISMIDSQGYPVENANNRVEVSVTGAGRLVGLDNGDSTDKDSYKGTSKCLFSGKLLAMIAAKTVQGDIEITVSSVGLPTQTLLLYARACDVPEGVSAMTENKKSVFSNEVPIRKIELISEAGNRLHEKQKQLKLYAKCYPKNATYEELIWRVTNDAGVDSNIADVCVDPEDPHFCTVTAKGDGSFRVRVATKNGADHVKLYSQLEFSATGLGAAGYDPYRLISASLYSGFGGNVGPGNERGVSMDRDGVSFITFENILFDDYGSDEIVLPIFELESRPISFEIWKGVPDDKEGELLGSYEYNKPTIWNVYQEENFRLPYRLTGCTTLSFRFTRKAHIKGFYFVKQKKAFARLCALENNKIYGDSFTEEETAITGIGNNVSLEFMDMDFGETGCRKLTICGRSKQTINTIHVRFKDETGETKQLAEFCKAEEYATQVFELEPVFGKKNVTFIFLPGCDFDFQWFQFE